MIRYSETAILSIFSNFWQSINQSKFFIIASCEYIFSRCAKVLNKKDSKTILCSQPLWFWIFWTRRYYSASRSVCAVGQKRPLRLFCGLQAVAGGDASCALDFRQKAVIAEWQSFATLVKFQREGATRRYKLIFLAFFWASSIKWFKKGPII